MTEMDFYRSMEETYRELTGITPDAASDTAIRFHTLAAELENLSLRVEKVQHQAFPQTAAGQILDLHAKSRGITRKPAAYASGSIVFSRAGAKGAQPIPKGTVCAAADGAEYETTETATLEENQTQVKAQAMAVHAGADGNAAPGTIVRVRQRIGIAANNPEPFAGGRDAESDDTLRRRLLDACSEPNTGINRAFYRQAAQAVDGVQSASCLAGEKPGEVVLYLAGEGAQPLSDSALASVQQKLDAMREPFAVVDTKNAEVLSTDCSLMVENSAGTCAAEVCSRLEQAVRAYMNALAVGEKLTLAALTRIIVQSGLAENWKFLSPAQDILPQSSRVVRAGTIKVQKWGS